MPSAAWPSKARPWHGTGCAIIARESRTLITSTATVASDPSEDNIPRRPPARRVLPPGRNSGGR
eukprot:15196996-Alexandrium_andersonii.AAC.1